MQPTTAKTGFWRGLRDGAPFLLVVGPYAMLFGVVATEAGMQLAEVMGFSVLVIAGASQFAALQLMEEAAPVAIVLATALAVNLRMAIYSASIAPHLAPAPFWTRGVIAYFLVDQSYAASVMAYERNPAWPIGARVGYFAGTMVLTAPAWYGMTLVGALAGTAIPEAVALDFALPITFLALVAPMLRSAAHVTAACVSVAAALALAWLPWGTGLLAAAALAMMAGAKVERWQARRGAA